MSKKRGIDISKSEQTALTLMGDSLGEELSDFHNLSLDELEAMLIKAYQAGFKNAKEEILLHGFTYQ